MDRNSAARVRRLATQAATCLGMIDEAKAKCRLMLNNLQESDGNLSDEDRAHLGSKITQIKKDLSKYFIRLETIQEELKKYADVA
jgi:hypothetical protein